MCSDDYGTITEFSVLELDKKSFKHIELLELSLKLSSL